MGRAILHDLGEEVTGSAAPVTICMAITVALVRLLNPEGSSDSGAVRMASIYYTEEVSAPGGGLVGTRVFSMCSRCYC